MDDWREGFVAMSAVLGEPYDEIANGLDDQPDLPLAVQLRDEDKARRALALARALGEIALAGESLEMELPS
jgi:hypothetical protein